ncbi:unnamed protein product [Trifolium pratense]|uniref:Uncharacterized protein n=1 Tax=Trifolium pratense TaxID=57577 RepID=A0ACB0M9P2_TRIPR|nr:unnamed protein product [Trifolium pratense]
MFNQHRMSDSNEESLMILENMKKRRRLDNQDNQNQDRLSELPDCVLLHILSFLNMKHVVQTCVLSKRWRHLWKRVSTLILDSSKFDIHRLFFRFGFNILTHRDTETALHALDLYHDGDIQVQLFEKILNTISSHDNTLQELGILANGDSGLAMSCVSSCHALRSLKLSLYLRKSHTPTIFPKSLTLPSLTSLNLSNFTFCGDESGCVEPFSNFTKLNSLIVSTRPTIYNISAIVNDKFEIDLAKYHDQGRINMSMFFALTYGFGFATIASTITHVVCFYGSEIMERYRASTKGKEDIHTKLMKNYKDIPSWWFYLLLGVTLVASLMMCIFLNDQIQMPWWGLVFASALAFIFTLPISIITATTNQTPGLNIITEYIFGLIYTGRPIANVCFKTYGYISMAQAVSFLSDFKLGHYMKIPPRSMFLVQRPCFLRCISYLGTSGPKRMFGSLGDYSAMNWFFLGGALGPILVWLLHKAFPKQSWIPLINLPVLLGATGMMPPATVMNFNAWMVVGTIFNFFIFRYRKKWWQRYNYVLSAALDARVAFMAVVLYFALGLENISLNWWRTDGEHCPLATYPTVKGIVVDGCPVF